MAEGFAAILRDRARLVRVTDGFAVAVVVSLSWSISATNILLVLALIAFLPTIDVTFVRREIMTLAGGLAVLLVALWGLFLIPGLPWRGKAEAGVVVRDYIAQSGIFAICALGLLG